MRNLNFLGLFALSTLSGCLWFLAVTPFDLSLLAWVATLPLFLAMDRSPSLRQAVFFSFWAGVVETAGGFYWLIDVMQRFAEFPWLLAALIFLVFCAARALIFVVFGLIVGGIRRWKPLPMTLLAPIAMVSGELIVPQIFPCGQWISQAWNPLVIQVSEITGAMGVTALLLMVSGAIYDLTRDARAARLPASVAALIALACLAFGVVRMRQVDAQIAQAPRLKIGLVQPNFAYQVSGETSRDEILRQLKALQEQSQRLEREGAQMLLWSEGAYPIAIPGEFRSDYPEDSLAKIRRGFSVPTLIGASLIDEVHDDAYNSALMLDASGNLAGRYDKVRLLAFGEYIPGIETFPWLRQLLPDGAGRFTAGKGPTLVSLPSGNVEPWQLAPVICYEDILPSYLQRVGRLRPNLLVNLTSDSWFGANTEPWEHLALAVFASVELRVSMVRAVNSGVSALIDANGRLVQKTYPNDPYRNPRASDGVVVSTPMMPPTDTIFASIGNSFAYLCLAASLFGLGFALWRRRRAQSWKSN